MGGTLDVQSTQGQGSCFWFTIPLPSTTQRAPAKTQDLRRIIGVKHGQKRVLIIDDKWENRSVLAHMLKHKGLTIEEASNGQEGLEMASRHRPDVISKPS